MYGTSTTKYKAKEFKWYESMISVLTYKYQHVFDWKNFKKKLVILWNFKDVSNILKLLQKLEVTITQFCCYTANSDQV